MLKLLNSVINRYKELYNKTEYYEAESTYDYNFNDWNIIKKANGKLTFYDKKLKKGKKYYYGIVAFTTVKGTHYYGKYSKVKSFTRKK